MSKFHEGYISVDHRASPGLPDNPLLGEGTLFEAATMHCAHCGTVVIMNPNRTRDREWCTQCDKYICDNCGVSRKDTGYIHKSYQNFIEEEYKKGLILNG